MNILVTNDDGIQSPGLWALAEAMTHAGNVTVVAPDSQRSGSGTSVTMIRGGVTVTEQPARIQDVRAYAVSGTPCDSVFRGLRMLAAARVDLLVSGINLGPNVGWDIPYSGTVMATSPAYLQNIPSIAVSLAYRSPREEMRFDVAARVAGSIARAIGSGEMLTKATLNVNIPNIPPEAVKGILVTRTARIWYVNLLGARAAAMNSPDPKAVIVKEPEFEEGTDAWAVENGFVSITPLRFDVTHESLLADVRDCVQGLDCKLTDG